MQNNSPNQQNMPPHPLVLALETSSRIGSVAIARGPELLAQAAFSAPMRHSAEIFPAISTLIERFEQDPADIEHIYISAGPGSFTGLRIAVTIAKALHLANPAKIVAVDTLDVIAANVALAPKDARRPNPELLESNWPAFATAEEKPHHVKRIAPVLDAKRSQFYIAVYNHPEAQNPNPQIWQKTIPDSLITAEEFLAEFADPKNPIHVLGDGLLYHKEKFQSPGTRILNQNLWSPQAKNVHALGWIMATQNKFTDPITLTPKYIRRPEAEEKYRPR